VTAHWCPSPDWKNQLVAQSTYWDRTPPSLPSLKRPPAAVPEVAGKAAAVERRKGGAARPDRPARRVCQGKLGGLARHIAPP
ncbi:unnamed protein product, partial [Rangifer tarandus platyrhynchus]